jgi:hypothetical protein
VWRTGDTLTVRVSLRARADPLQPILRQRARLAPPQRPGGAASPPGGAARSGSGGAAGHVCAPGTPGPRCGRRRGGNPGRHQRGSVPWVAYRSISTEGALRFTAKRLVQHPRVLSLLPLCNRSGGVHLTGYSIGSCLVGVIGFDYNSRKGGIQDTAARIFERYGWESRSIEMTEGCSRKPSRSWFLPAI